MLNQVGGYWLAAIAPYFFLQELTTDPFPPGTNVYASISLSQVNTVFEGNSPGPKFVGSAFIDSWSFYNPDGGESAPQPGTGFTQNSVTVENCARIKFTLAVEAAWAIAQINVFTF